MIPMIIFTVLTLAAAIYAHYLMGTQVASRTQRRLARFTLIGVGLGFGWALSTVYLAPLAAAPTLTFLAGFGAVHVPAACILWLKRKGARRRGTPPPC